MTDNAHTALADLARKWRAEASGIRVCWNSPNGYSDSARKATLNACADALSAATVAASVPDDIAGRLKVAARALVRGRVVYAEDIETLVDVVKLLESLAAVPATRGTDQSGGLSELRVLHQAASKGFHTSETCGPDGKFLHVSRFPTLSDLHAYDDAWTKAMLKAQSAPQVASQGAVAVRIGTNSGHGHVWDRPDGFQARCGGATLCDLCRADLQEYLGTMKNRGEVQP